MPRARTRVARAVGRCVCLDKESGASTVIVILRRVVDIAESQALSDLTTLVAFQPLSCDAPMAQRDRDGAVEPVWCVKKRFQHKSLWRPRMA